MYYWMKRSGAAPEGLDHMSRAEILRGIVTEKLTTAAEEILAVVERTVAGYEEEASGFRREIARQRRQLEAVLQPRVKLERRALIPDLESHDVVGLSEGEEEEEEEATHQTADVEDHGSLGFLWYDDDDYDEEEQPSMASSYRQKPEDLQDPDFQIPSRVQSEKRRRSRPQISESSSHLDLRICFLEDRHSDVISVSMLKKSPVQELQCPRGLQEADFLDLLRSTFPQLTADEPFDVFTADRARRLHPLQVQALTPEEISRSIRATGAGKSALYIRLKRGEDPQTSGVDLQPWDEADGDSSDQTGSLTSPSEKRRRGRPKFGEEPTHHLVRICVLDESESDVLSKNVFTKSSVQELQCPRGLQEADFLDLLRSTFPQLAGENKQFNMFRSDRSRRLQRLRVKTITPEEIYRSMKSTGGSKTLVYIRLKTGEEEEEKEEEEELSLLPTNDATVHEDADADDSAPAVAMVIKSDESGAGSSGPVRPSSSTSQHDVETDDDDNKDGDQKLGLDHDWKPNPQPKRRRTAATGRRGRRAGAPEKSKTPCRVCGVRYRIRGSLIKHAWSHVDEAQGVCGVCGERFEPAEELKKHLRNYRQTHSCSFCGKSFSSVSGLSLHTTVHTGNQPFKCDVCGKTFARKSSLSIHRWVHVAEKPHKCEACPKAFGLKAQLTAHSKVHVARERYVCNVCGKSVYDLRSLTRHKATHSGERRYGCEVCGKRFKILGTLRSHEKIHTVRERPYLCDICCKTFVSNSGLMTHMRTHGSERPFVCVACGKGFISNGQLKAHARVHTDEAPYGCSQCGRHFKRKTHLNNHVRTHLGIKLFVCGVCGKPCSRQEHLNVHMRTHNGERPYKCSLCDKAFTQSHCLKTHMKIHQAQEVLFLDPVDF